MAWFQNAKTGVIVSCDSMPAWGGEWKSLSTPARKVAKSAVEPVVSVAPSDQPSKSASRAVWAKFAESKGIETDGLTRKEIIERVEV